MPRPRLHTFWVEKIRELVADDPSISAAAIRRKFKNEERLDERAKVGAVQPTPVPSARVIGRYLKEFRELPLKERQPYSAFSWPGSMESGALPWEASRAALDLLRYRVEMGLKKSILPRVGEVRWFWRVTQAVPDAPLKNRATLAGILQMRTEFEDRGLGTQEGKAKTMIPIQWELAYQPWRSDEDKKAHHELPKDWREMEPLMQQLLLERAPPE